MNFKDVYREDLENAFFDEDEFAEKHMIDGKEYTIVLTEVKAEDAREHVKKSVNPKETAINKVKFVLYIREKDVERKITVNSMINLDGKKYFVLDVIKMRGVYKVSIGIHAV